MSDVDEMDEVLDVVEDRDALQRDDDCVSAINFAAVAAVVALPLAIAIDVEIEVAVAVAASSASTSNIIIRVVVGESVTLRAGILHGPSTDPDPDPDPCKGDTVQGESLSSKSSDIIGDGFNLLLADNVITGVKEAESEDEVEEVEDVDKEERDDTDEIQGDIGEEIGP